MCTRLYQIILHVHANWVYVHAFYYKLLYVIYKISKQLYTCTSIMSVTYNAQTHRETQVIVCLSSEEVGIDQVTQAANTTPTQHYVHSTLPT